MTEQRRLAAIVSASRATRDEKRDAGSIEKSSAGGTHQGTAPFDIARLSPAETGTRPHKSGGKRIGGQT